jgi:hypothetical protein
MPKSLLAALLRVALTAAASVPARAQQTAEEPLPTETVEAPVEASAEAPPPALPGAVQGDGPWIARIEIRSDAPIEQERELRDLVTFRPGDRLTEQAVRRTLRNLQATGTAYEVELHTRPLLTLVATAVQTLKSALPNSRPPRPAKATAACR